MNDEAEALCAYLPALVRDGGITERERKFVASVIHQRRRWPGRALSEAQVAWLRRIVRAFQERTMRGPLTETCGIVSNERGAGCYQHTDASDHSPNAGGSRNG